MRTWALQTAVNQPDELHDAHSPIAPLQQAPLVAARCVNGTILRPRSAEDEHPSTACQHSEVCAPGGVPLGRGTPGQHQSPGGRRGRDIEPPPPPPPPPPPVSTCQRSHISNAVDTPAHKGKGSRRRRPHQEVLPIQGVATPVNGVYQAVIHQEEALDQEEALGQEEQDHHLHPPHREEEVQEEVQEQVLCREELHLSSQEEEQELQGLRHLRLQALHNLRAHQIHGVPLDRSRKALPKLMLPSNYKACNILEMRQLLESWYDRCTFAVGPHGEEMHRDIGLMRFWIVREQDMINGSKAHRLNEQA